MKYQYIIDWIKNYANDSNIKSLVVGVSGGIDSAVTSTLCALTGLETVVVNMPIQQSTKEVDRGLDHINWLNNKFDNVIPTKVDLNNTFNSFLDDFSNSNLPANKLAEANTRSRLRMVTLYHMAAKYSGIVVGTGNKVEDFGIGFYTKYGDGGVDISPIADLMKSEVYDAGIELGIIDSIMLAAPTDGLWGDTRTDEDQIGASYNELEWAMTFNGDKSSLSSKQKEVLEIYNKFNTANKHKMLPIPVCIKPKKNGKTRVI